MIAEGGRELGGVACATEINATYSHKLLTQVNCVSYEAQNANRRRQNAVSGVYCKKGQVINLVISSLTFSVFRSPFSSFSRTSLARRLTYGALPIPNSSTIHFCLTLVRSISRWAKSAFLGSFFGNSGNAFLSRS